LCVAAAGTTECSVVAGVAYAVRAAGLVAALAVKPPLPPENCSTVSWIIT